MKEHFFDIDDPVFRCGIRIYYKKPPNIFGEIPNTVMGRSLTDMPYNPCIWFRGIPNVSLIVHELVHCVSDIMRKKGIPMNSDTEEVFAYMIEFYLNRILEKFPQKIKK